MISIGKNEDNNEIFVYFIAFCFCSSWLQGTVERLDKTSLWYRTDSFNRFLYFLNQISVTLNVFMERSKRRLSGALWRSKDWNHILSELYVWQMAYILYKIKVLQRLPLSSNFKKKNFRVEETAVIVESLFSPEGYETHFSSCDSKLTSYKQGEIGAYSPTKVFLATISLHCI